MSEELTAGRELDALVAERVMGWTYQHDGLVSMRWYDAAGNPIKGYGPGEWGRSYREFAPSTDIAAAWLVWDKLAKKHNWELCWRNVGGRKGWYICDGSEYECVVLGFGETVPLAICAAALQAVAAP